MVISMTTRRGFTRGSRYLFAYRLTASATRAGSSLTTARPSSVLHRRPSTWVTATAAPSAPAFRIVRALCDVPEQITRAIPASTSSVAPTGVACTVPSARTVLSTHRCRSVQKPASRSLNT